MTAYLVTLDNQKPFVRNVNLIAEILDDTEPLHSRSTLTIRKRNGLKASSSAGSSWADDLGSPIRYAWDAFEAEWTRELYS